MINMPVASDGGHFLKRNWREVAPAGDGMGAVRWHLLGHEGAAHVGCLRGLAYIDREMVQPGSRSAEQHSQDLELVYYVLAGQGQMIINGHEVRVLEGDAIHLPKGTPFQLANRGQDWLTYLIIAAP
ncbi:MAG: cupin domain-containing protein [Chloroflexi bacterium]|nr:cupin domain-containing protein [Chloroflexota bacterium]